jgi:hypothetical protein
MARRLFGCFRLRLDQIRLVSSQQLRRDLACFCAHLRTPSLMCYSQACIKGSQPPELTNLSRPGSDRFLLCFSIQAIVLPVALIPNDLCSRSRKRSVPPALSLSPSLLR